MRSLAVLLGTLMLGGCGIAGEAWMVDPNPARVTPRAACPGGTATQTRRTADINPLGRTRQTVLSGETCLE
jgi:hypothetical protein